MRIDQHQHSTVAPQIHNRRILVIDDDPAILELFSRTFVYKNQWIEEFSDLFDLETGEFDLSFELSTASQGEEGVALIQQAVDESAPFALVFLDVRLPPGIDGLETARKIREIDSDVHIVISSAYTDYQPSDFRVVVFSHLYFMRKPLVVAEIEHMAYNASYSWNRNRQLQQELDTNIAYQSWLSQLFNELPMPIMVIDTTNHQVLMSGGTYHSDTSKSSCYKMRYNRDTPCDESMGGCPMEEACSSGNSTMKNHTHIDAYGEKRHYEVHCVPVHNPKIGSHQVLEFFIDVTERHYRLNEKEREIRQQTQLFDTFRSTAHTMKNSIGYLNGMVDHVAAVKERTGELGELLSPERVELIREQVTTIMSLLLLALRNAKGDANRVAVLSVQKKIDEVLSLFAISTLGKGKEVALQLNVEHEVCIRLPAIDCQTMLINLLNNAADAVDQYLTERATAAEPEELMALMRLQEEPMITLEVTQRKELLFIEISNLAKPIPMEVLPTIFEKGFSTKESGNGVGLYDVRQIIKQAGGDISVSNQEDGVTFALNLPLVDCDTTKNGP